MPLRFGPLKDAVHLCIDMQRVFVEETRWHTPWAERVMPQVARLCERHAERTIFTRFVPLERAETAPGTWQRYYEAWPEMTLDRLAPAMLELAQPLAHFSPPAMLFDKRVLSPWHDGSLAPLLIGRGVRTLIVSGLETEVCVLATVLGAVDHGFRVVIAMDAICGSADETHDAMSSIYESRYGLQVETAETDEIIDAWRAA